MSAARERNMSQVKQEQKKKRQLLPGKNKKEVAYYAWIGFINPIYKSKIYIYQRNWQEKKQYLHSFLNNKEWEFFALPRTVGYFSK